MCFTLSHLGKGKGTEHQKIRLKCKIKKYAIGRQSSAINFLKVLLHNNQNGNNQTTHHRYNSRFPFLTL